MAKSTTARGGASTAALAGGVPHYERYKQSLFFGASALNTSTGGIYLCPLIVEHPITIDRIVCGVENAVGDIRLGIYDSDGDAPDTEALLAESAAVLAVANEKNELAIVPATLDLDPDTYWLVFAQSNDALNPAGLSGALAHVIHGGTLFARGYLQAFGAFADPCPVTAEADNIITMWVRVMP